MSREANSTSGAMKALIVIILVAVVGAVIFAKNASRNDDVISKSGESALAVSAKASAASDSADREPTQDEPAQTDPKPALPRLVDLGAGQCIPCKMMTPVLEELKNEYANVFSVEFIDVWEDAGAKEYYQIHLIPTQIFYDAQGDELFRHEGFFGKEEILGKWRELGVETASASN